MDPLPMLILQKFQEDRQDQQTYRDEMDNLLESNNITRPPLPDDMYN